MASTHQNHLVLKWAERPIFNIGQAQKPMTVHEECLRAARLIAAASQGRPITVALSGGLDSECVAQSFLEAKVPFRAAIMRFNDNFNMHDIRYALQYCEENNLNYDIYDLNIIRFLETGQHLEYARRYRCSSPQIAAHLWLADQISGEFIFAGSPVRVNLRNELVQEQLQAKSRSIDVASIQFVDLPSENQASIEQFCRIHNRGIANFFLYTPELILACASQQDIIQTTAERFRDQTYIESQELAMSDFEKNLFSDWLNKYRFYLNAGFILAPRANKFNGFEHLQMYYGKKMNRSASRSESINYFNQLFRLPMQEITGPKLPAVFQFGSENLEAIERLRQGHI